MPQMIPKSDPGGSESPFDPQPRTVEFSRLRPLLQRVLKPGRYCGGEFGIPPKEPLQATARMVLCYPDVYELGMSNQGLKILYDFINRRPEFLADRAFLPWPDFASLLTEGEIPLYSLDHFLELRSFDIIGFNTAHELLFTNLLFFLELGRIPLGRLERGDSDPLIITGGTAISNPLPLFDFMDGIFLGDGEEGVGEILELVVAGKKNNLSRREILHSLARVEGLLLPDLYTMEETAPGEYPRYRGPKVKKRLYRIAVRPLPEHVVVPGIEITQDRVVVEAARGCGRGCRFCHAGFWKRPVRNTTPQEAVRTARCLLEKTGADSISLHSLSIADYPQLRELIAEFASAFADRGISLSLPSLRVRPQTIPLLLWTQGIRKSSVTFALEAGGDLLRERIHKKSTEADLHRLMEEIFKRGWNLIKVYFMLGLPDPDGREVEDLLGALRRLDELARRHGERKNINVTISLFVPKPFTTFEWERQRDPEYFREAIFRLKAELRSRRVHLKHPAPWMAYIEGLLSRGDSRTGQFILSAYREGAHFDSWDDRFRPDLWMDILKNIPETWRDLWLEGREPGSHLPWHDIIEAVSAERLLLDHRRFEEVTPETMKPPPPFSAGDLEEADYPPPLEIPEKKFQRIGHLRLEFAKTDRAVYLGHLDTAEVLRRAMRRAGFPLTFSRGFNKHEKLIFSEPLPLYVHSQSEILYVEIHSEIDLEAAADRLRSNLPPGFSLLSLDFSGTRPEKDERHHRYRLEFQEEDRARQVFALLREAPENFSFRRPDKKGKKKRSREGGPAQERTVERRLGAALSRIELRERTLDFSLEESGSGAISLADLLIRYLDLPVAEWNAGVVITRMGRG